MIPASALVALQTDGLISDLPAAMVDGVTTDLAMVRLLDSLTAPAGLTFEQAIVQARELALAGTLTEESAGLIADQVDAAKAASERFLNVRGLLRNAGADFRSQTDAGNLEAIIVKSIRPAMLSVARDLSEPLSVLASVGGDPVRLFAAISDSPAKQAAWLALADPAAKWSRLVGVLRQMTSDQLGGATSKLGPWIETATPERAWPGVSAAFLADVSGIGTLGNPIPTDDRARLAFWASAGCALWAPTGPEILAAVQASAAAMDEVVA